MTRQLPELQLTDWNPTRDTLHQYARTIGKLGGRYMPKSKHWWHITLSVSARGLTTTPFPISGQNLELTLDLALPEGAYWHTEGWTGAVLPYAAVVASDRPQELLLGYLRTLQAHGAKLMS